MIYYGCHNRKPYKKTNKLLIGWSLNGKSKKKKYLKIPFTMAQDCQYTLSDLGKVDSRCENCKWKKS